jgi:hypothetical protein
LARLERSTLARHNGTRTVVLRYLKIITPVKCVIPLYDGYIAQPEEGEFHRRFPLNAKNFFKEDQQVLSIDIDQKNVGIMRRGLQLITLGCNRHSAL